MLNKLLVLVVLIGCWQWWRAQQPGAESVAPVEIGVAATPAALHADPRWPDTATQQAVPVFVCDGRQHCSQMRSRAEAEFFIANCPNTKMDGDRDGIPCENDSRW